MTVDLFVRVSEDNVRFTPEFHQYMVFPDVELKVAQDFLKQLDPHSFAEGETFQKETMRGHCGYNVEQVRRAFDVLPKTTMATAITDLAGWVANRKLTAVDQRADRKGVLVTGIYEAQVETAQAATAEVE